LSVGNYIEPVNLETIEAGIYLLQLKGDKEIVTKRIVVE
jgi:hypothetical protein